MENIRSGRLTERMLRCTDNAIAEVHAIADETDSSAGAIETYRKVAIELNTELARQRSFTDKTKKKSCAKACLEAYLHHKVFRKVQTLLQDADGQAAVVASTASVSTARCALLVRRDRTSREDIRPLASSRQVGRPQCTDNSPSRVGGRGHKRCMPGSGILQRCPWGLLPLSPLGDITFEPLGPLPNPRHFDVLNGQVLSTSVRPSGPPGLRRPLWCRASARRPSYSSTTPASCSRTSPSTAPTARTAALPARLLQP